MPGRGFVIPPDLAQSLSLEADARITAIEARAGGGASRQGAELALERPDGSRCRAYLSYDTRHQEPKRLECFRREVSVLRALTGYLGCSGVRAPRYLASDESHLAILTEIVAGEADFSQLTDPSRRQAVAHDFMAQLATLHRIDIATLDLPGFPKPAPPSAYIKATIARLRAENLSMAADPILILALDWLERNIPSEPERSVLLHGDAGPANFLFQDGVVTGLLDWEFTHFGDPMEDLAQICVRGLFQPFIPLPEAFSAYQAAGGARVDLDRIRYHRLYFQVGFTVDSHAIVHCPSASAPAIFGMHMIYHMAHMRVIVESLAALMGVALAPESPPELPAELGHRSFDSALRDIQDAILPELENAQARAKAKGIARLIKWWRAREVAGYIYDQAEMNEIAHALDRDVASVAHARGLLVDAILERRIGDHRAIRLCHQRMLRETTLMADAMGSLARCRFAPID